MADSKDLNDQLRKIKQQELLKQGYEKSSAANKAKAEIDSAKALVKIFQEQLRINQMINSEQAQYWKKQEESRKLLLKTLEYQKSIATSDAERLLISQKMVEASEAIQEASSKYADAVKDVVRLNAERRKNIEDEAEKVKQMTQNWKSQEQIQENIKKIEADRQAALKENLKNATSEEDLKRRDEATNKEYDEKLKLADNSEFIKNLKGQLTDLFGDKKGGIADIVSSALSAKSEGSGVGGFLKTITGAGGTSDKVANFGGVVEKLGSSIGGKAGSVLGSAGGAISKLAGPIGVGITILKGINKVLSAINKQLDQGVQQAVSEMTSYLGKMNARLQGSEKSFGSIQQYMENNFKTSPFVNQQKLLSNIASMVDKGIVYNLEERAVLETLSDRMVSTFDTMDATLLQLTRLQRTDLTVPSMGYEAMLTKFLNEKFQDTSYLSDVYDQVSAALLDASANMNPAEATAMTNAVQKWLGSLYSVGMSSSAVTKIAQGINYLATGNVEALNSDDGLRNLFAMTSTGAYSSILTGGINATNINELLSNIVVYLKDIASDTNNVTKQAMSGVFGGFSFADLRAVNNLTNEKLDEIYNYFNYDAAKSYAMANWEVLNQLEYVATAQTTANAMGTNARISAAEQIDNMMANAILTHGLRVAGDSGKYKAWRALDTLGDNIFTNIGKFLQDTEGFVDLVGVKLDSILGSAERYKNKMFATDFYKNMMSGTISRSAGMLPSGFMSALEGMASILGAKIDFTSSGGKSADAYTGGVVRGLSSVSRINLGNNVNVVQDFSTSRAVQTTSVTSSTSTHDVSQLYTELFEKQTSAMKVTISNLDGDAINALGTVISNNIKNSIGLSSISEEAVSTLADALHASDVSAINEKLSRSIDVNVNEDFVSSINSGLMYARSI